MYVFVIEIINNKARHNLIMQNINRWRSDLFQPPFYLESGQNKSDANLEDSDCTVRMLLFVSIEV